jgi:lipopolysaccharide transport system ATP-binding protein
MSDIAIRAEGLSKLYRIGARERYQTLRDTVTDALTAPFRPRAHRAEEQARTFWALRDVSFEVKHGEVVGIIGRNGAGKSTLLRILSRITEPTGGRVEVRGRVASLLEVGTGFHPELTGRDNIYLNGAILGMKKAEIERKFDEIVAFAEVEKFLDTPVKHYSSGMYVRLAFAVAAHLDPEILVIDEVLAVGDTQFQKKCLGKMGEAARSGRTVLFVSHQLAMVENLCSRAVLLDMGRTKFIGSAREAISVYVSGSGRAGSTFGATGERRGTGTIRLEMVALSSSEGTSVDVLVCGGHFSFELRFRNAGRKTLRSVQIDIGVDNALSQRVTTWSTSYAGGGISFTPDDDFSVNLSLPKLALIPGSYTYNVFVTVNGEVADWLIPAGSFNVEPGDFYSTGHIPAQRDGVYLSEHSFHLIEWDGAVGAARASFRGKE